MTLALLKPTKGRLLVSVPFLNDRFFGRSVILLTEHNEEGSVGLIINKPLDSSLQEAIPDFPDFDAKLYLGGPVENNSLFFIHTCGDIIPGSMEIDKGLFWGGNFDHIRLLIEHNQISPTEIRFFVGYSGWSANQLDRELQERTWVVQSGDVKKILVGKFDDPWRYLIKRTNKEYSVWADFPVNPSLN